MSKNLSIWGTVKVNGTGKRVACCWNGKLSYTRRYLPSEPYGGIKNCNWPEVWTFKPNDPEIVGKIIEAAQS